MKLFLTLLLATLPLLCCCDRIEELFNPSPPAAEKPAAPIPELLIIGVPEEDQVALKDLLQVRGLLRQGQDYVVMINTQLVRKGELLVLSHGDKVWQLEILSVDIDRVKVRAVSRPAAPPGVSPPYP